jgi:integrase
MPAISECVDQSVAYKNFISSINSEVTKKCYHSSLTYFMKFTKLRTYDDLIKLEHPILEGIIRDYIIHLRQDKKLSPTTVSAYLAGVMHFFEMNDISLRWNKLKKFKAKFRNIIEDRPYTRQEIKRLLDIATLRDRCIILVMASAGLRRGALPHLRLKDIQKIDKYNLYRINVYRKEQESYITYCTPECTKCIEQYLQWRERLGEKLQPYSPLFRITFDTVMEVNRASRLALMR